MTTKLRTVEGQFIEGQSGNKGGRPPGAKNKVTLYKLEVEEAFRSRNQDQINDVLDAIVAAALEGDKAARKMVWDASVSKASVAEDKTAGAKQSITVHHMNVNKTEETSNE